MKIVFVGSGRVGGALATKLGAAGHDIIHAQTREDTTDRDGLTPLEQALPEADAVFLAVPYAANEAILRRVGPTLAGKVVVDCTNPVGPGLTHGLSSTRSGSELIQALLPAARVVKAFSIYGYENLEDPVYPGYPQLPAMLFCGDDEDAKTMVADLIRECGFEPLDVGGLVQALHLEHMTLMWVRMVRVKGQSPHLVWGAMRRPQPS